MKFKFLLSILVISVLISSCDKSTVKPDNIYQFKNFISYTTSGVISTTETIEVNFSKTFDSLVSNKKIIENTIAISPYVEGSLKIVNDHAFVFKPDENLNPNTEYTVTIQLDKIYKNTPEGFEKYTFQFKTIQPSFNITTSAIQSYSKEYQFVNGVLSSADFIPLEKAKQLVKAFQAKEKLPIQWNTVYKTSKHFEFKIDSIKREIEDSKISVSWNGKAIEAENKGENSIVIPGRNNFKVIDVSVASTKEQYISINFSDPLKKQQNFKGLIQLENNKDLKTIVNGNELKVYPTSKTTGNLKLSIFEGVKNKEGFKLTTPFEEKITFQQKKPAVRLLNSGTILPNSKELKFNFEAINVQAVNVRIIKIFEDNVLQFLQENNLNSSYRNAIKKVGRRVAKQTIQLIKSEAENTQKWKAYSVDISKLIKTESGAIYRVEVDFNQNQVFYNCVGHNIKINTYNKEDTNFNRLDEDVKEELYWDNKLYRYKNYNYNWQERDNPCHEAYYNENRSIAQNILASNIGVIAKKGTKNSYFFATTNIITADPESNTKISLYNYQQQEIATSTTDKNGFSILNTVKNAAFAVATKNDNYTYIKLQDGNALSLSKFNVSGTRNQKGLKGFIYTERGVWRPGDTIFTTFILNDANNKLPKNHPVKIEVTDPSGKLVFKKIKTKHLNRFYTFQIPTQTTFKTGNYSAKVQVGGAKFYKNLKVETIKPNRLKIKIDFDDEVLSNTKSTKGKLQVNWLHGAPAKNVKAEIRAKVSSIYYTFKNYKNYTFQDPARSFSTEEITIFDEKLDENGAAIITKNLKIGRNAPGMLNMQFLVRAFEKGGDFSLDAFTKRYAPYQTFIGLQSPKSNNYGSFFTNENQTFQVISVNKDGKTIPNQKLKVEVYKIDWRWWWSSGSDNLSKYTSSKFHKPYTSQFVTTNTQGKSSFTLNIPEEDRGRFLIRVIDTKGGHATGRIAYFYKNWWQNSSSKDKEAAKMLVFSADKETYTIGEKASITFPSGSNGKALLSIENGAEILETQWVNTTKGTTTVSFPITKKMAPNVFVNISLIQPHQVTENDLPIRLYGVIPILAEDNTTKLQPQIQMPNKLQPEKEFAVTISEKNNRAMTYTIAVVEEGLLALTRFKTPNAHTTFYAKEALGVKTWDIFDDVIGAYSGNIDQVFEIGGDGSIAKTKNQKANRFKPVVKFLGPFQLEKGSLKTHNIQLPNYIGAVKTMVIAGDVNTEAFGSSDKATPVKKALMVLATLPRKLSPKEKVTLPITIFAMDKKVKDVTVHVKTSDGINVVGNKTQQISFNKPDEKMLYFQMDVLQEKGIHQVEIIATGNGEKATHKVELDVVNPNPVSSTVINETVTVSTKVIKFNTFGIKKSNTANIEFSTIPNINFTKRLQYLIQYPHGCVEQTTSSIFPQLFMTDIFDLSIQKKREIQNNIEKGIKRLGNFQQVNGGFSYWIGENYVSDWGTSYAGHFLLEAEQKGFVLPLTFKSNFIKYQKNNVRNWRPKYNSYTNDLAQAYRLYTLALAGSPDLSAMNRLREFKRLSNNAKWRLAATYALVGQKEASKAITNSANLHFKEKNNHYYTYGSTNRNRAMALETLVLTESNQVKSTASAIAKALSSKKWMSTQTTAYCLLSIAKMVKKNGGKDINLKYVFNGKLEKISSKNPIIRRSFTSQFGLNTLTVTNSNNNTVFVKVINSGKLPLGKELTEKRGFTVSVNYKNQKGDVILIDNLKQGDDFLAEIKISNPKNETVRDIALTQIFPSGWEIVNTRFTAFGKSTKSEARYTDVKDDRINFYFDLYKSKKPQSKTFTVLLNAAYLGNYYLPGIQVEAMYDNDYLVRTKGKWVTIEK